jgi:ABC-2 type transport system permease protein
MVIMVIMTGICVTNEFALGTIVQLLSYPFKRYKILLAKIATLLLSGYLLLMVLYAVALIYGHAFLGGNLAMLPQLVLVSGEVQEVNFYLFVFLKYNLCFIEMSVYICLTVLLSILSRSAAITIGLGIPAALVFKELVRFLARQFDIANLKFVPFVSYDFNQFLDNNVVVADITILFAVVVTMLSLVFINLGSFAVLQRKDV